MLSWSAGQQVVRREIWRDQPWLATVATVVEDSDELLATYIPEGSPFAFPPSADGRPHPWSGRPCWEGNGVLMLQRPGEAFAVWHFWHGPHRVFTGWYLNLQEPFRRTAIGYDTQDLELDILVSPDGGWERKDEELLDGHIAGGRFDREQVEAILRLGDDIEGKLAQGRRWWDDRWAKFIPDPGWVSPTFPGGWERCPVTSSTGLRSYRVLPT